MQLKPTSFDFREELCRCRNQIEELECKRDEVFVEIEKKEQEENM